MIKSARTLSIVYLDDEIELCSLFKDLFEEPGIQISTFSDHEAVIDYCLKNKPDLVFLDYRIPKLRGDLVAAQLPSNLNLYLVTGELDLKLPKGFEDCLSKPFDIPKIKEIIASYRNHFSQELLEQNPNPRCVPS